MSGLFEVHPEVIDVFQQSTPEFTVKLSYFYHNCLHILDDKISEEVFAGSIEYETSDFLISRIYSAKSQLLHTVRSTVNHCILAPVMNQSGADASESLELLLHLYTGYLSESTFFTDYNHFFALEEDMEIFRQLGVQIDPMRIEYLRKGIPPLENGQKKNSSIYNRQRGAAAASCEAMNATAVEYSDKGNVDNANDPMLESLVSGVRDLFPQLGEGFLAQCLPYFDSNPEKVINALLEDNLPPHLADLDRTLAKPSPQPPVKVDQLRKEVVDPAPAPKFCDNTIDDMNISKLHRGKKKIAKNANALLNDKSDLAGMKERFASLSIVKDEIYLNPGDYFHIIGFVVICCVSGQRVH